MAFSSLDSATYQKHWLFHFNFYYQPGGEMFLEYDTGTDLYLRVELPLTETYESVALDIEQGKPVLVFSFDSFTAATDSSNETLERVTALVDITHEGKYYVEDNYVYFHENFLGFGHTSWSFNMSFKFSDTVAVSYGTDTYVALGVDRVSITKGSSSFLYGLTTSSISGVSFALNNTLKFLMRKGVEFYMSEFRAYMLLQDQDTTDLPSTFGYLRRQERRMLFLGFIETVTFLKEKVVLNIGDWTKKLDRQATFGLEISDLIRSGPNTLSAFTNYLTTDNALRNTFVFGRYPKTQVTPEYNAVTSSYTYDIDEQDYEGLIELTSFDYSATPSTSVNRYWGFYIQPDDYDVSTGYDYYPEGHQYTGTYSLSGGRIRIAVTVLSDTTHHLGVGANGINDFFAGCTVIISGTVSGSPYTAFDRVLERNNTYLYMYGGLGTTIPYSSITSLNVTLFYSSFVCYRKSTDTYVDLTRKANTAGYTQGIITPSGVVMRMYAVEFDSTLEAAFSTFFSGTSLNPIEFKLFARVQTKNKIYYKCSQTMSYFFAANGFSYNTTLQTAFDTAVGALRLFFQYPTTANGSYPTYRYVIEKCLKTAYAMAFLDDQGQVGLRALHETRTADHYLTDMNLVGDISVKIDGSTKVNRVIFTNEFIDGDATYNLTSGGGYIGEMPVSYGVEEYSVYSDDYSTIEYDCWAENILEVANGIVRLLSKRKAIYTFSVGHLGLNWELGDNIAYRGSMLGDGETERMLTIISITYTKDLVTVTAADLYGIVGETHEVT